MKTSEHVVWLAITTEEKDRARLEAGKLLDGRSAIGWEPEAKLWYARPGCDLDKVREWLPDKSVRVTGGDPHLEFKDALTQAGLIIEGLPVMDGKAKRVYTTEDKKGGKKSGVYRGFDDRRPGGWFINYHTAGSDNVGVNWKASGGEADPVARMHIRAAARQASDDSAREQATSYAEKTQSAKQLLNIFSEASDSNGYARRKGITLTPGLKETNTGSLVIPFFDVEGQFKTFQYIPENGSKSLYAGAPKQGSMHVVGGELSDGQPILYAEGYATARSINMALGIPVVMTIDAGNMATVAGLLKEKYPDSQHYFMSDFDHTRDVNKGLEMATAAAQRVGGVVIYPNFTDSEKAQGKAFTDFNDLHRSQGLDELYRQILPQISTANKDLRMSQESVVNHEPNNAETISASLSGINYSELVLIHATSRMPNVNADGSVEVKSAFHNAGGFEQVPDSSKIDERHPQGVATRPSIHFTIQDPVRDHLYGSFEGREVTIYASMKSAIEKNGAPETLLAADTAFFSPNKAVSLPDAVIVQLDLKGALQPDEFAKQVPGGWLVAATVTDANRAHASALLTSAERGNPGLGALETLNYLRTAENGPEASLQVSKTLALNDLNAPTVNKALGLQQDYKIGMDGWASHKDLEQFKQSLPVSDVEKNSIVVGRHDRTAGDDVNTWFRRGNQDGLNQIGGVANPAIAEFAGQVLSSDLHKEMRKNEILAVLATESYTVRDDAGRSDYGLLGSIYEAGATEYTHAKLGRIASDEVQAAIQSASPAQTEAIQQHLLGRGLNTDAAKAGDEKLALQLGITSQASPMPPIPGSPGAAPSLGSDVPPPFPASLPHGGGSVPEPMPPIPGSPGAAPSLGSDVPPPFPTSLPQGGGAVPEPMPPIPGSPGAAPSLGADVPPPHVATTAASQPAMPIEQKSTAGQEDQQLPVSKARAKSPAKPKKPGTATEKATDPKVPAGKNAPRKPAGKRTQSVQTSVEQPQAAKSDSVEPVIAKASASVEPGTTEPTASAAGQPATGLPAATASVAEATVTTQGDDAGAGLGVDVKSAALPTSSVDGQQPVSTVQAKPDAVDLPNVEHHQAVEVDPANGTTLASVATAQPGAGAQDGSENDPTVSMSAVGSRAHDGKNIGLGAGEASAEDSALDGIWVGPRIPRGQDNEPSTRSIDKDALLSRVTWEEKDDKSVLYKLDGDPAFIDRGSRLEMVPGSSQNDEKIVAALLTAARFYSGRIELTGSAEFKAKAIALIAQHEIQVTMKNPLQQAQLEDAQKALATPPRVLDAIKGDDPVSSKQPGTGQPVDEAAQQAARTTASATAPLEPAAAAPLPESSNAPKGAGSDMASQQAAQPIVLPVQPAPSVPQIDPSIHQRVQAAENGVTGKIKDFGKAPYRFETGAAESFYLTLRSKAGFETYWGKELSGLVKEANSKPGDLISLKWLGKKDVQVQVPVKDAEGQVIRHDTKDAHRNQWRFDVIQHAAVRATEGAGEKPTAFDANRFAQVQQQLLKQLPVTVSPVPNIPQSGLLWLAPNGEASRHGGDALTAPRPATTPEAGSPLITGWGKDGQLDLALFRSDGNYLQGVVRHNDQLQHVLVSLPGTQGAPAMVFNAVTDTGLVPIGAGNGINKASGQPVSREHIGFRLDGDTAARVAKLDSPGDVPATLHSRLGFDERWKDDNSLPKSGPAAAPPAPQSDHRPR